jgi:RNA recognition motif-containing protein
MSGKVNEKFLNFVNLKKNKPIIPVKEVEGLPNEDSDSNERKYRIVMKKDNKNPAATSAPAIDDSQNDGSLKALLSSMSGTVINKVVEAKPSKEFAEEEEEEASASESESDGEENITDSESEDDYEEERYNHFAKNSYYEQEVEEEIEQEEDDIEQQEEEVEEKQDYSKNGKEKRKVECEIFAESIPLYIDEKQTVKFLKALSKKIVKVKVLKDKETGKCKGKAFIKFFTQADAQEVMKKNPKIDGTALTLTFVKKFDNPSENTNSFQKNSRENNAASNNFNNRQEKPYNKLEKTPVNNNLHTAFIRNLPLLLEEKTVNKHFRSFGKITNVRLMKTGDGKSKGFGYVDFESEETLTKAISGSIETPIIIEGKQIYLEKAKSSFNEAVYEDSKRLGKKKKRIQEQKEQREQKEEKYGKYDKSERHAQYSRKSEQNDDYDQYDQGEKKPRYNKRQY